MFKRQLSKKELDRYITDNDFTKFDILKEASGELFAYNPNTLSAIHDSIRCTKEGCKKAEDSAPVPSTSGTIQHQHQPASEGPINFASFALEVDEDEEDVEDNGNGDEGVIEIEANISSLAKWAHYDKVDQLPQVQDELPIVRKLWNYTGKQNVGITFMFYRKTDPKDRVELSDAAELINFMVSDQSRRRSVSAHS
jgi:hypothetical protein